MEGCTLRVEVLRASLPVSFADVLRAWQTDAAFRSFFLALLADSPFAAYRWECPPISTLNIHRRFEFVMLDSPGLAVTPDVAAFAEHFTPATIPDGAVSFPNLGNDAILVVPCPVVAPPAYGHLAAFVRRAPEQQQHALWRLTGEATEERLGPKPTWLSTAGDGVAWLHVRLDERPKYYRYQPYRSPP